MPWEHRTEPVASRRTFTVRLVFQFLFSGALCAVTIAIGVIGYRILAGLNLIDAFLESAMFLSGAGPIYTERSSANDVKLFSSFYAIFCTLVVVTMVSIIAAPIVHRILHRMHLERAKD